MGDRKHFLLILALWCFFNLRWLRVVETYRSYSVLAEIASFSSRDFSRSNKHDKFGYVVSVEYFYVLFL